MTELSTPIWIELTMENFDITHQIGWPLMGVSSVDLSSISSFAKSFLDRPTNYFTAKINEFDSTLHLVKHLQANTYRGIIIPGNFPSLEILIKGLFQSWTGNEYQSFEEWLNGFFRVRLDPQFLTKFQVQEEYNIKLPPIFLLSQQQINGVLLHKLRSEIDSITQITQKLLHEIVSIGLPENYLLLLERIPAENELTNLYLINAFLHTKEIIDYEEYLHLKELISTISPIPPEVILLNYLQIRLSHDKQLDDRLFQYLMNQSHHLHDLTLILVIRVLILHFKHYNIIQAQDDFNQLLLQNAPILSWSRRLDLINAQIGLASTSVTKGDYFRAMTFYSFARQGFNSIGMDHLRNEMEAEFQRISTLSATQQLQTGMYLINHHNTDRSTLLLLIDGIQNTLTHFIRYHDQISSIEEILSPLLLSAAKLMDLNQSAFNKLVTKEIAFDEMLEIANLLTNPQNRTALQKRMQTIVEQLSFKDQKIIERISVFYDDGRHIGDYRYSDGNFVMMNQDANQALFSSAMSAVSMLISEATATDEDVDEISVGSKKVIYDSGDKITFCLICNSSSANLKQLLRNVVVAVEKNYQEYLKDWSGNINLFRSLPDFLGPLSFYAIDFVE